MEQTIDQENVLDDIRYEWQSEYASTGQRFANYIIDMLSFYAVIFLVTIGVALIVPGGLAFVESLESTPDLLDRFVSLILYGLYMGVVEGLFGGRSLGKLITRTRAIRDNGETITWGDALLRGCTRMVPFEVFSGLGARPWHDKWTNTRVVRCRRDV